MFLNIYPRHWPHGVTTTSNLWFFWGLGDIWCPEGQGIKLEVLPPNVMLITNTITIVFDMQAMWQLRNSARKKKTPRCTWCTWLFCLQCGFGALSDAKWLTLQTVSCSRLLSREVSPQPWDSYLLIEGKTSCESRPCASLINMKISLVRALLSLPKWPWLAQRWQSASLPGSDSIAITARLTNRSH